MKKIYYLLFALVFTAVACQGEKNSTKYYERMADSEMIRNPESWMVDFSDKLKWNYCHGLELGAIYKVWEKTGNQKYYNYAVSYADTMVKDDGTIKTYKLEEYNIDRLNSGKMLFPIYAQTENPKYKKALDLLVSQMDTHPRISNGGFWHKKIYPHQVWLDGLYMAGPFLAEYGATFDKPELFDEVVLQLTTAYEDLLDEKTGLLYHGWDESREQRWADPVTGRSPNFWSRSIGWYMMALVDALDFLPENHAQRNEIIQILHEISTNIEKFQDQESGMWYQVTDQGNREGNYLESSGSIMFIYTWVKGGQKGYLPKEYLQKGIETYDKFITRFIKENEDGTISVTDGCSVAGLGGEKYYRDGSFEYYISEPIRDNDPKALSPFILVSLLLDR